MELLIRVILIVRRLVGKILPERMKNAIRSAHATAVTGLPQAAIPVKNNFKSKHSKKVLFSYIVGPFLGEGLDSHSNRSEALVIAECFDRLGYSVDVVPYTYTADIDYSGYTCVFGLGEPVERSFYQNIPGLIKVYYATGKNIPFQNSATLERARSIYERRRIWLLDSCRLVPYTWPAQTTLADAMVVIGNQGTIDTYTPSYPGPIFPQIASYNAALPLECLEGKDFVEARKNYLYFSSMGAVHKGLDLLLEVFADFQDATLHVVAPFDEEAAFVNAFSKELALPNVRTYGFVDIHSKTFHTLMRECAFAVLPSCAEGIATSLLNVMCNGLVPVLTPECGYDPVSYAVPIETSDYTSVKDAITFCSSLSTRDVEERSSLCMRETREKYSLEAFRVNMENNLSRICSLGE